MPVETDFVEHPQFLDLDRLQQAPDKLLSLDDAWTEITFNDVEDLINASAEEDFARMAIKFSNCKMQSRSDFDYEIDESDHVITDEITKTLAVNALGFIGMKSLIEKAIGLKELREKRKITKSDLDAVGIRIYDATAQDYFYQALMEAEIARGQARFDGVPKQQSDLIMKECFDIASRVTLPRFSCRVTLSESVSGYSVALRRGIAQVGHREGWSFAYREEDQGYSFDLINEHFPDDGFGYRDAVQLALDNLFKVNLIDVVTVTECGLIKHRSRSVYAAFWYMLSRSFEGARTMRCVVCDKPMVVKGERGKERLYCSQACSKWAQRNPGKKRNKAASNG